MTTSPFWTSQRSLPRVPLPNAPRPTVRRRAESARQAEVSVLVRGANGMTRVVSARARGANALKREANARVRAQIGRRLAANDPHAAYQPLATSNRPRVPPARNETVRRANTRREVGTLAVESSRLEENKHLAQSKRPVASNASPRGRRVASASGRRNPLALNHAATSRAAASREPVNRAAANPAGTAVKKDALRAMRTALRVTKIVPHAIVRSLNRLRLGLPQPSRQPKNRQPKSPGPTSLPPGRLAPNPPQSPRSSPRRPLMVRSLRSPAWA
jgi:hypothetical protein